MSLFPGDLTVDLREATGRVRLSSWFKPPVFGRKRGPTLVGLGFTRFYRGHRYSLYLDEADRLVFQRDRDRVDVESGLQTECADVRLRRRRFTLAAPGLAFSVEYMPPEFGILERFASIDPTIYPAEDFFRELHLLLSNAPARARFVEHHARLRAVNRWVRPGLTLAAVLPQVSPSALLAEHIETLEGATLHAHVDGYSYSWTFFSYRGHFFTVVPESGCFMVYVQPRTPTPSVLEETEQHLIRLTGKH